MKNNLFIISSFLIIILSSCSKEFLDTEIITEKTTGNFYSSPEEAQEALTGCYDGLQLTYSDGGIAFPVASDVMSDLCFGGTGASDADNYKMIDEFDKLVSPGDLNMFDDNWIAFYKAIYRSNVLISHLDDFDWGSQVGLRNEIEAEARFIRAYCYFDMARLFERVPVLTEPSNENIIPSEPDEIYRVITEDLLFVSDNAKDQMYGDISTDDYGHASKWAAEALLGRVYLFYTGYYNKSNLVDLVSESEALALLEDVIDHSGHDLVTNFADLWPAAATYEAAQSGNPISQASYAGENNMEVVFGIKYTHLSDFDGNLDGNHWLVMNGLRKQAWAASGYGDGWGACTVPPEVYANYDANDKRREASIMAIAEEGINYEQKNINDVKEYTGYFTKKYTPLCDSAGNSIAVALGGVNFMIGQYQDYFAIRFADVLLMAAELGSPNALDYVNKVRNRAGLTDPLGAVDKDIIYEERKLELAFEGIRYYDLLRYDHTLNYAAEKISYTGTVLNGGNSAEKVIDGNNLKITRGLSQIPNNQVTATGGVVSQNEGW